MNADEIRAKVKEVVTNITNIDPEDIADDASYVEDLGLDSLSLMEIGVDVDYAFKLGVPEERMQGLRTVQETVDLVLACLAERGEAEAQVA